MAEVPTLVPRGTFLPHVAFLFLNRNASCGVNVLVTVPIPETPREIREKANGRWPLSAARQERTVFLERKKVGTKADLLLKFEDGDWHGVADAAMDLRDIESELAGLRYE